MIIAEDDKTIKFASKEKLATQFEMKDQKNSSISIE